MTVSSNQNVSYQWSSDGTGSFDNSTDLNTIYRPSLADLSGTVSLVITVTKTDNGCDNIVSDTIIVSFTQGTTIDAGGDLTACQGPGVTIQPNGSVLNEDSFYWSSGGSGSFNGTETNEDPTYSPSNADYQAGQVSLTLIATTAGECEGIITETIFVTLYQAPVFSIDEDADNDGEIFICSSAETININASLNVSQTSVSNLNWSGGVDGNFISGGQTFNATYRFGANEKTNGSVTLRLDADGENGCANPDQKVVIVTFLDPIANPPVKNLDPGVACLGQQNIILSVNAIAEATSYNWTVPAGIIVNSGSNSNTVNVSVDPQTTTGSKTILVTAQNDCGITSPTLFELYVSPDNIGTVSGTNSICRGDLGLNYTVDDIPGAVYSWSYSGVGATVTSGNNTNEITVDYDNTATSGSWTVTASLSCGTVTAPVNYVVTVNEIPQIDPASIENQYCSVSPLGIQLSFSNKILSEIATITWQRDQVAGVLPLTGEGNGSEINESLTNTTNSNALIVYTISTIDNNGCENQETISFELYPELNITNSNKSICSGENVDLTFVNNNTSPQLSYSWSRVLPNGITSSLNGGFNGNTISETLINSTTNSIDVIYNVTSQVSGCAQTNAVTITVHPFASFTAQTLYSLDSGQTTSLDLSNVTDIPSSISWAIIPNANVTAIDEFDSSPTNLNQVLTNTTTTTQIVEYVISMDTNQGGCTSTQTIRYQVFPCPQITSPLNQVEICSTDNFNYTVESNMGDSVSYSWSRDAVVGIQNNASTGSTKYINEDLVNTTSSPLIVRYNLNVTSNVGTCITNQTLNVLVKPNPEVTSPLRVNVCHGETLNYQITSGVANTSFNWAQNQNININSGATSSANNSSTITQLFENDSTIEQTVTYDITGTYDGCSGQTYQLEVIVSPEPVFVQANDINNPLIACSNTPFTQTLSVNNDQNASVRWTRDGAAGLSNGYASGTNAINETLVNTTTQSITVQYNIGVTTSQGCSLSSSSTLYVVVLPTPALTNNAQTPSEICSGQDVNHLLESNLPGTIFSWSRTLPGSITSNNPIQYQENNSNVINETLSNSSVNIISVSYQITLSGNQGCDDQVVNIQVPVYPSPDISSVDSFSICSGESTDYTITSNVPASYSWQRLSNVNINNGAVTTGNSASINEVLTNTSTQTQLVYYEIVSTDSQYGCVASTATVVVSVNPTPEIQSSLTEDICSGDTFNYTIEANFASGVNYSWSRPEITGINGAARNGNGNTISEQLVNSTPDEIVVPYTIVVSYQGCTTTSTLNLTV